MGTSGLNELEQFAKEAADLEWMAFLGDSSPLALAPQSDRGIGEDALQDIHELAKAAFVDEVAGACAGRPEALTWALSLVDEQDLDTQIAKVALALGDEPQSVHDFVFSHAGRDTPLEDFHELAKVAFVEELHELCGGDVALVKEALALVDDEAFDIAVASEAMGLEKVAGLFQGGGRALLGLAGRAAGAPLKAIGGSFKAWGEGAALANKAKGIRLARTGKDMQKGVQLKVPGTGAVTNMPAEPLPSALGKFRQARGEAITSDIARGKVSGSKRQRFGDMLTRKGNQLSGTPTAPAPAPAVAKTEASTLPLLKDKPPVPDGAKPLAKVEGGPLAKVEGGPLAEAEAAAKVKPEALAKGPAATTDPNAPKGAWDGVNEWFTNATPLQKLMVGGGGLVGAEAALD